MGPTRYASAVDREEMIRVDAEIKEVDGTSVRGRNPGGAVPTEEGNGALAGPRGCSRAARAVQLKR